MKTPAGDLEKVTRASYNLPVAVEHYSSEGLSALERHVIERYLRGGRRLLELGCGAGRLTHELARSGGRLIASDIAPNMLRRAQARLPEVRLVCADACRIPHPDATFDAVFFGFNGIDCLLPFARRDECLAEMRRVLAPGGHLVFSSHNRWFLGFYLPTSRYRAGALRENLRAGLLWRAFRVERHPGGQLLYLATVSPPAQRRRLRQLGFIDIQVVDPFTPPALAYLLSPHPYYICRRPV